MPPIRSMSATKPVKTERTHEENQERAYIAASRRSDRSLEARVESARRASEIHKRRTGRSLRVTEQDVVNEEMYEEEDDDLPLQYRRLTAHLNSGDPHFNRRLAAYLTNHVAMRSALDQAISSSYAQQYPNGQPWQAPYQGSQQQQQQPWMMNQMQNQQTMQQPMQQYPTPMMMPPQMVHRSPSSFRQTPYPMPGGQSRSMSASVPQDSKPTSPPQVKTEVNVQEPQGLSQAQRNTSSGSLPNLGSPVSLSHTKSATAPSADLEFDSANGLFASQSHSPSQQFNMGPFSTALPRESQMFFGSNFDQSGAFASNAMMGAEKSAQPFYNYNPNSFNKTRSFHPSYDGMSQTLAPNALDNPCEPFSWPTPSSATTDGAPTPFMSAYNYPFDMSYTDPSQKFQLSMPSPQIQGSGYVSPVDPEWSTFIDSNSWAETTA